MKTFDLVIVTPDGEAFSGMARSITLRTTEGDISIMAGHADVIAALGTGVCRIVTEDEKTRIAASDGGFLSVQNGAVRVVTTTFEFSDQIDLMRAKAAKERAEARLQNGKDERDVRLAKAKLSRAISRIRAAKG